MTEPERPDDLLTVRQAAKRMNVDIETLRRWIRKGAVRAKTICGAVRIERREVESHIVDYVPIDLR